MEETLAYPDGFQSVPFSDLSQSAGYVDADDFATAVPSVELANPFDSCASPRLPPLTAGASVSPTTATKPCCVCARRKVSCDYKARLDVVATLSLLVSQRPCRRCIERGETAQCFDRVGKRELKALAMSSTEFKALALSSTEPLEPPEGCQPRKPRKSRKPSESSSLYAPFAKSRAQAAANSTFAAPACASPDLLGSPNLNRGRNLANPLYGFSADARVRATWIQFMEKFDRLSGCGDLSDLLFGLEMLSISVPPGAFITIISNWRGSQSVYAFLQALKSSVSLPARVDVLNASRTIAKAGSRSRESVEAAASDKDVPVAFMISTHAKTTAAMPRVEMSKLLYAAARASSDEGEQTRALIVNVCRQLGQCGASAGAGALAQSTGSLNASAESKCDDTELNRAVAVEWIERMVFLCEVLRVTLELALLRDQLRVASYLNHADEADNRSREILQIKLESLLRMGQPRVSGDFQTPTVNSAFELLFGYTQAELRGLDISQVLYKVTAPEDWRLINIAMLNASVGPTDTRLIIRCCTKFKNVIGPVLFSLSISSEHPDIDTCSMSFVPIPSGFQEDDGF